MMLSPMTVNTLTALVVPAPLGRSILSAGSIQCPILVQHTQGRKSAPSRSGRFIPPENNRPACGNVHSCSRTNAFPNAETRFGPCECPTQLLPALRRPGQCTAPFLPIHFHGPRDASANRRNIVPAHRMQF